MRTDPQTHQNDKSRWINVIQRLLIWCGEGDLNPHEITPASTSTYSELPLAPLVNDLRALIATNQVPWCLIVVTITSHRSALSAGLSPRRLSLHVRNSLPSEVNRAAACF